MWRPLSSEPQTLLCAGADRSAHDSLPLAIAPVVLLMVVVPHFNRRVQVAFRCCANELIREDDLADDRVRFRAMTLQTVIAAIQSGAAALAKQCWARYCDFVR